MPELLKALTAKNAPVQNGLRPQTCQFLPQDRSILTILACQVWTIHLQPRTDTNRTNELEEYKISWDKPREETDGVILDTS
jgi:hypothetical protein